MFSPTRDQARRFFVEAWNKQNRGLPLTQLERLAAGIVALHPEYHALLERGDEALAREWTPEGGETNPFLHLSLHLAVEEQLAIDQPPGVTALFASLLLSRADRHAALHEVLECLGETVWQAQRNAAPPDAAAYLDCVRRRL
ncbi:MAG TPA: DUF1841 family protein [Rhodocyclaceae bacterium]|nr:DUF1841 family protein [Rhodocyclaceae bacterium]